MMLLGAGASAGFGIPTMKELTTECYRILETEGFPSDEMEAIKSSLTAYGFVADFEALLTILDALTASEARHRGIGKSTLHYLRKKAQRERASRVYSMTMAKLY